MTKKSWLVCRINGVLELVDEQPGNCHFMLAVGERDALKRAVHNSADPFIEKGHGPGMRVPGTQSDAEDRENLSQIAQYIQTLRVYDSPSFRALGA